MFAWDYESAVALNIGVGPELESYQDGFGKELRPIYINSYVAYWWSGMYVPEMANFALYGCVGLIIFVATLRRIANHLYVGRLPSPLRKAQTFVVKHLFLSSTFGTKALEPISFIGARGSLGRWTSLQVPARVHGILVSIYVILNLLLLVTPYRVAKPSLIFQDIGYQLEVYIRNFSDRTGILSFGATPLVYILASRNSPIIWLTGTSYSTLQIYHRWVGRMVFMHAFLHSLGWTVLDAIYSNAYIIRMFTVPYWNWGCGATACGAVLILFSIRRLREISYEVFLVGHIVANIIWIVGCYYHVFLVGEDVWRYLHYIYAAVGIWAAERVFRLLGVLWINTPSFRSSSPSKKASRSLAAEGYLVGTGDFIRLRLSPSTSWPASFGVGGPGSYVFISTPGIKIHESHPFTIAWPSHMPSPDHSSAGSSSDSDKQLPLTSSTSFEETETDNENSFELILKSYSGYTKRLAHELAGEDGVEYEEGEALPVKKIKILIEGPYGGADTRLEGFRSIILVAGGSGISATIAHLADLAKRLNEPGYRVERINVIWAIRQTRACDVLIPYLLRLQNLFPRDLPSDFLTINIYYTGETRQTISIDEEKRSDLHASSLAEIESLFKPVSTSFASVHVCHGRPAVAIHLEEFLQYADGGIALSTCGPSGLCDVSREAVKARMGGKGGVDSDQLVYHEEAFTW